MAAITSIGVGSGLQLEELLNNIITAEKTPTESRLNLKQAETEATISAYGNLKATLSTFQESLTNLKDESFFSSLNATSGDSTSFTATAENSAAIGNHDVAVLALAAESKVTTQSSFSSPADTVGEGTLTIGFNGGSSFDITVEATTTLAQLRDSINNATENVGVTASLLTVDAGLGDGSTVTELVLASNDTGAANQIDISVNDIGDGDHIDANGLSRFHFDGSAPDAVGNQLVNQSTAQDAQITVDGFNAFSSTNTFDSVISGVTIKALKEDDDPLNPTTAVLNIAVNTSAIEKEITTFAGNYNELMIVLNSLTDYDEASKTRGILGNDSSARLIEEQIRGITTDLVEGAPSDFNTLAFLGFETNKNGTITLNEEKLSEAAAENFNNFSAIFAGDKGLATKLDSTLTSILQSDGTIDNKEEILDTELKEIEEERLDLAFRLEKIEERLRSQFAALDILVTQLNQTGSFLKDQLASIADIGKKS